MYLFYAFKSIILRRNHRLHQIAKRVRGTYSDFESYFNSPFIFCVCVFLALILISPPEISKQKIQFCDFFFFFCGQCGGGLVVHSCPTHCDPVDCSLPGSLSVEFSRQECWSGLLFPSPGDLPNPGIKPRFLHCRRVLCQLSHKGSPDSVHFIPSSTCTALHCMSDA